MRSSRIESHLIFHYLSGQLPLSKHTHLYQEGITKLHLQLPANEQQILDWVTKYPFAIRMVDLGLALFMPKSVLRQRFLLATSIIESDAAHLPLFLNKTKTAFPFFKLLLLAITTAFMLPLAFILFKLKRWK
jgi:hypothetical protein